MGLNGTPQLLELKDLTARQIEALWAELFGTTIKTPSRREFVLELLAYRIQEKAAGGLSAKTRKRLRAIGAAVAADPTTKIIDTPQIKPGTRLIREWKGETHVVMVVENGFGYSDKRYKSLSEIARLITGTRWSGPRFFGLTPTSDGRGR